LSDFAAGQRFCNLFSALRFLVATACVSEIRTAEDPSSCRTAAHCRAGSASLRSETNVTDDRLSQYRLSRENVSSKAEGCLLSPASEESGLPQGWAALAGRAEYRPGEFARLLGMSLRNLERLLQSRLGKTPFEWLNSIRQCEAMVLLLAGKTAKETALELRYKRLSHFSREFKRFHKVSPSTIVRERRGLS
jgi:AraC-like DNA-binding protein